MLFLSVMVETVDESIPNLLFELFVTVFIITGKKNTFHCSFSALGITHGNVKLRFNLIIDPWKLDIIIFL